MLGKTPAGMALAAAIAVFMGAADGAAQSKSAAEKAADTETAASPDLSEFISWRDRFRAQALKAGIPHHVFDKALGDIRPNPEVQEKNEDQPEFTRPVWEYLDGAVSDTRVKNGRKMMGRHASLLAEAEKAYGVPRRYLVAIWGLETSYGALLGNHNIFKALATLSYRGDRRDYGEEQLLAALRLLADGHKPLEQMKGSWAGAVGHTQFVPTTYLKYAVDGDHDGRRDLWDSLSDVFHSTAHYLKESGFDRSLKWGREASLPKDFDYGLAGYHISKPLSAWRERGVKMANGALVPDLDIEASILVPAGHQGPAFLIYKNFQAILEYNRSTSYALAIGLLSDQLRGGPSLKKSWPRHLEPLRREERVEIQQRLAALGYEPGKADGILGRETRKAIRQFQKDQGDIADGYATAQLLGQLRTAKPAAESGTTAQAEPSPSYDVAAASPAEAEGAPPADPETGNAAPAPETPMNEMPGPAEPSPAEAAPQPATRPTPLPRSKDDEMKAAAATEDAGAQPAAMPKPRDKDEEFAENGHAAADASARPAPRPHAEPAAAAVNNTPHPRAEPAAAADDDAPAFVPPGYNDPPSKSRMGGIISALSSPGLVIVGKGVAAPVINRSGEPAAVAVPVNGAAGPIVSPPGTVYVGTGAVEDDADTSAGLPENDAADEAAETAGEDEDEGAPDTDDLSRNFREPPASESSGS